MVPLLVSEKDFIHLIREQRVLVDVRSPIEFSEGHFPNSINLPILTTEERVLVGTVYVQKGSDEAIRLGHQLVMGDVKRARVQSWINAFENGSYALTCFRGGLRSQIAQSWCLEAGLSVPRVEGGTKSLRRYLLDQLEARTNQITMIVVCGPTGSGKSTLLKDVSNTMACLDLETLAHHRGSAFGGFGQEQPSQILFENTISYELIRLESKLSKGLVVEDESRMIGRCTQPDIFFKKLRESEVVFVDESLETRTQNIFDEYILATDIAANDISKGKIVFDRYIQSLHRISKKLGGVRTAEILSDLNNSKIAYLETQSVESNKVWIQKLLAWYYDPLYKQSLEKRNPKIKFQGSRLDVIKFLTGN